MISCSGQPFNEKGVSRISRLKISKFKLEIGASDVRSLNTAGMKIIFKRETNETANHRNKEHAGKMTVFYITLEVTTIIHTTEKA